MGKPVEAATQLIELFEWFKTPITVAAVPADMSKSITVILKNCPYATVVQHVYNHTNSIPTKVENITYVNINYIRDNYAALKLFSEFYEKLLFDEMNLPWLILRLFNVYGLRMVETKYGQVIPEFITRLRSGEYPLSMYRTIHSTHYWKGVGKCATS